MTITENERAVFHDLIATLQLIQEGKVSVSATTRQPTIGTVRALRQRLLFGDDLDDDYERAEEAIRPLALVMLVQAAKWAAPGESGGKLRLTKTGWRRHDGRRGATYPPTLGGLAEDDAARRVVAHPGH